MRSLARFTVVGISGVVLFKLFATILFPLLGMMLGLLMLTAKLALVAALIFFIMGLLKKRDEPGVDEVEVGEGEPPPDDE